MASITTWTRLEPRARTEQMDTALQARVWDPLWLLARQWQVGELTAEDSGTPVVARIEADCARVTRYLPAALRGDATDRSRARAYDTRHRPLETLVERERLHEQPSTGDRPYDHPRTNLRAAAEAGLHFARLLAASNLSQYRAAYLATFALRGATAAESDQLDADTRRWLAVMAGRVIDGTKLHASLAPLYNASTGTMSGLPATPSIAATDVPAVTLVAVGWMKWYGELFDELPAGEQPPWNSERMEYEFAVATPPLAAAEPEVVLAASEYVEGRLDWHAFELRAGAALGATGTPAVVKSAAIPVPVRYPGMPSSGWFEMEDGRVNLGAVDAAPEDLARILVSDFALSFADDWFLMPFELEVGSVCRIRRLAVTDTFGIVTPIPHYADVDRQPSGWSFFSHAPTGGAATTAAAKKVFMLAPTLNGVVESRPVEEVVLLRDEMANMAWGVERVVESAAGRPFDRLQLAQEHRRREEETAAGQDALAPLVYRLIRGVPEHWVPLVPQRVTLASGRASIRLRRARMLAADGQPPRPRGRILEPDAALSLFDETVPRAGARVTRAYQLARWTSGSTHLWAGRRTSAGQGEGSSGLRFDVVEPRR